MLEARYAALPDGYGKAPIARALGELYLDALRDPPRAIEWMRRAAQSPHPEDALAACAILEDFLRAKRGGDDA
jgi:TPR repeat protein